MLEIQVEKNMVDPKKIDDVLNILYNNTSNNHITRVRFLTTKVFLSDIEICRKTVDYIVDLGYIKYKGNSDLVQLTSSGKDLVLKGGFVHLLNEDKKKHTTKKLKIWGDKGFFKIIFPLILALLAAGYCKDDLLQMIKNLTGYGGN